MSDLEIGRYSPLSEPLLELAVRKNKQSKTLVETCLIDTGFNRGLLLYSHMAKKLDLPFPAYHFERIVLATGDITVARIEYIDVEWLGQLIRTETFIIESKSKPDYAGIVGMEFLLGNQIAFDFHQFEIRKLVK